jgi:hypothetical protein
MMIKGKTFFYDHGTILLVTVKTVFSGSCSTLSIAMALVHIAWYIVVRYGIFM